MPLWRRDGVVVKFWIWYQREASRPPESEAVPVVSTWMLWLVQRVEVPVILFLRICAWKSLSSRSSNVLALVAP